MVVLQFFVFVHRTNFHLAHEIIWQVERCLHFAIFPESWFSVNRGQTTSPFRSEKKCMACTPERIER